MSDALTAAQKSRRDNEEIALALIRADVDSLKADVADVVASVRGLMAAINTQGKVNWGVLAACGAVIVTIMSAICTVGWFTINQDMQLSLAPVSSSISRMGENQHAHDEQIERIMQGIQKLSDSSLGSQLADIASKTDRGQLNERVRTIEQHQADNLAERKGETASLAQKLAEVETQFRAGDAIRNVMHDDDSRLIAVLWGKLFPGIPLPQPQYFPQMAQTQTNALGH